MEAQRRMVVLGLVGGLAGACGHSQEGGGTVGPRPNIILVSIDSLRADHLGCYGYARETSPTIDRLAAQGVRFETALSTTSWTLPAHAAMFTGLYDSAHGLVDNGLRLADEHRTLAEVLREKGYATAGFFGGPYLHPTFGLEQGFDVYQSCMTRLPDSASEDDVRSESRARIGEAHADITGPRTLEEIERWAAGGVAEPYFLFVHLWDVHYDFIPPAEYVEMFDPGYEGPIDGTGFMTDPEIHARMAPRDFRHLIARYDGEIRFTDDVLGRILEALEGRGMLEDTVVVVTADHGEEFFEHAGKGHQRTLFDEVVRVPLVVSWPGRIPAGVSVPDQVRLIDLMPTLLTLAGVTRQPKVQGRDLSPFFFGGRLEAEPALCELLVDRRELRALRTQGMKVLDFRLPGEPPRQAWFDLERDPREERPVQEPADERLRGAARLLEGELARTRDVAARAGRGAREIEIDEGMKEELRRLGYLGDGHPDETEGDLPAPSAGGGSERPR